MNFVNGPSKRKIWWPNELTIKHYFEKTPLKISSTVLVIGFAHLLAPLAQGGHQKIEN